MVAMVIDTLGVRLAATAADMRRHVQGGRFFWLDVFGGDEATRTELLQEMGLDSTEIAWALRFGQSGRMYIGRNKLRVVTWMADPTGDVHEVHVFSGPNGIMTIWHGDATALSEIRQQFGERVAGLENSPYGAAGILLQLLAGTLDHTLHGLDLALDELRARLDKDPSAAEFALRADQDCARLGVDKELGDVVLGHPVGVGPDPLDNRKRLSVDRDLARPGERRPPVLPRVRKGTPVLGHLGRLQPA